MPLRLHYPKNVDPGDFYCVPISWLRTVTSSSELDVGEALLFMLYTDLDNAYVEKWEQQRGIDDEDEPIMVFCSDQRLWTEPDACLNLPALCVRHTYGEVKDILVSPRKLFRRAQAPAVPPGQFQYAHREMNPGLLYERNPWRTEADNLIFAPRGYMEYRWPAWFGKRRPGARVARLALCALTNVAVNKGWTVDEIFDKALALLPQLENPLDPNDLLTRAKIADGLELLEALGAVQKSDQRYQVKVNTFAHRPYASYPAFSKLIDSQNNMMADRAFAELMARIMSYWLVPVTQFDEYIALFETLLSSSIWFVVAEDFQEFSDFIYERYRREQRKRQRAGKPKTLPAISLLVSEYIDQNEQGGRSRVVSEQFDLQLLPDARAVTGKDSTIQMRAPQHRKPDTIQIHLRLPSAGQEVAQEAYAATQAYWLVAEQVKMVDHQPKLELVSLSLQQRLIEPEPLDTSLKIDANELNRGIDLSQPFRLFLLAPSGNPVAMKDSGIELSGHVIALYPKTT